MWFDITRKDGFSALGTRQHTPEVVPTVDVPVQQGRPFFTRTIFIAPVNETHQHRIETKALFRKPIFVPQGCILIDRFLQNAMIHEVPEPLGQHPPGNPQILLKIVKSTYTEERLTQDQKCPAVPHYRKRPRKRTVFPVQFLPLHARNLPLTKS